MEIFKAREQKTNDTHGAAQCTLKQAEAHAVQMYVKYISSNPNCKFISHHLMCLSLGSGKFNCTPYFSESSQWKVWHL